MNTVVFSCMNFVLHSILNKQESIKTVQEIPEFCNTTLMDVAEFCNVAEF